MSPAAQTREEGIGDRIARLRRAKKWTQRQLAEKVGIRSASMSKYERGAYTLRADALVSIARVLNTSIDFLLTGREAEIAEDTRLRARIALIEELPRELRDHVVSLLDAILQAHRCLVRR